MANYLDQLKSIVSEQFKNASTKEAIDASAQVSGLIEKIEGEQSDLLKRNAELLTSYKEVVQHAALPNAKGIEDTPIKGVPTFEDSLAQFAEGLKAKEK